MTIKALDFDSTGWVVLKKEGFKINKRWEEKTKTPDYSALEKFVNNLSVFKKDIRIFIFFSPERKVFHDSVREKFVEELGNLIEARYKNIRFYNNYNLSYSDSLYVDVYHFNDIGRKLYTEMVIRELSKFIN